MKTLTTAIILLFSTALFFTGCGRQATSPEITDARKALTRMCREDHGLDVLTKQSGSTLWIYWPTTHEMYGMQAKPPAPAAGKNPGTPARSLNFVDVQFDESFKIQYDITPIRKYPQDPGYSWNYSPPVQEGFSGIRTAIGRAFSQVEEDPNSGRLVFSISGDVNYLGSKKNLTHKRLVHAYVATDDAPEFFVIVIANIKNGLAFSSMFYIKDLLRGMTDPSFSEEFYRRSVTEDLKGDTAIIGDTQGKHLDIHAVTWPEFLSKQMVNRIKFKYQRSDFPPEATNEEEILSIVHDAVSAYGFDAFDGVVLEDLAAGNEEFYSQVQIRHMAQDTGDK